MNKRWTLLLLAIVVMAMLITACQPADSGTTDAPAADADATEATEAADDADATDDTDAVQ